MLLENYQLVISVNFTTGAKINTRSSYHKLHMPRTCSCFAIILSGHSDNRAGTRHESVLGAN